MRVKYSFSSRRTGKIENIAKQKVKFPVMVRNMIKICDVILEVLDARYINETRNVPAEESIKSQGKKIIYVINKMDLVDINEKKMETEALGLFPYVFVSCKKRIGSKELRNRIKIEVKRLSSRYGRAQVGVIGYPNTGKSSLINFLTGKSAARTASEAGFTRGVQRIKLSSDILILDTPGIIPGPNYEFNRETHSQHAQIGARTYDKVRDPEFIVHEIIEREGEKVMKFYGVEAKNSEEFFEEFGKKRGLLLKGGVIDTDRAARIVLKDWQEGKIK